MSDAFVPDSHTLIDANSASQKLIRFVQMSLDQSSAFEMTLMTTHQCNVC